MVDVDAQKQLTTCLETAGEGLGVLCGDHHIGYSMPIGGVIATQKSILPAGVGFDIGCGNLAVRTNLKASEIPVARIMDEVFAQVSFGVGRNRDAKINLDDWSVIDTIRKSPIKGQAALHQLAANQLGTVGSGNHYVDLFCEDATGDLWIGVHFGSRGFGHKTASGFLAIAKGFTFTDHVKEDGMFAPPDLLSVDSPSGQDYLEAMRIAGEYAYQNREYVVKQVLSILGAEQVGTAVHTHHNFAWREQHFGQSWLVTRKGATPAFPGQLGFVGASMAENSVILQGVDSPDSVLALYSTMHGAGRARGRRSASARGCSLPCSSRPACRHSRACGRSAACAAG